MKFELCPSFIVYLLVLTFALIFTQALRSSLSSLLYVGTLLFGIANLAYMFICAAALKASAAVDHSEVPKLTPVTFRVELENPTPLPMPFVECDVMVPEKNAVRCSERRIMTALLPNAAFELGQTVAFSYRGNYSIGLKCAYVTDLFRMFRFRLDVYSLSDVFVMPRRLIIAGESDVRASDVNTDSMVNLIGAERSEVSDIRDYRQGDHMKSIHWKLSSKKEDLITKEYSMNSGKTTYVFADMARRYDRTDPRCEDDINEFSADTVVETAIAASMRELKSRNTVTLMWYDDRSPSSTAIYTMQTSADFTQIYPVIATAPSQPEDLSVADLASLTDETHAVAMLFVTPRLDEKLAAALLGVSAAFGSVTVSGAMQVLYCPPEGKLRMTDADREFEKQCLTHLRSGGIKCVHISLPAASPRGEAKETEPAA